MFFNFPPGHKLSHGGGGGGGGTTFGQGPGGGRGYPIRPSYRPIFAASTPTLELEANRTILEADRSTHDATRPTLAASKPIAILEANSRTLAVDRPT